MGLIRRVRDFVGRWFDGEPCVLETAIERLHEELRVANDWEKQWKLAAKELSDKVADTAKENDRLREMLRMANDEVIGANNQRMGWFDDLARIRKVHDGMGQTLATLLEMHAIVGCRLDALAEEICPVVAGNKAGAANSEPRIDSQLRAVRKLREDTQHLKEDVACAGA